FDRPEESAAARGRLDRLRAGFFCALDLSYCQWTTGGGSVRLCTLESLHLRPDLSRGELEHFAARERILDDRAGDGVYRSARQHGCRREDREISHPRYPGTLRGGPRVVRQIRRQGIARATGFRDGAAVPARHLHGGGRAVDEKRREIRISRRVWRQPAIGARALADRETFQMSRDGFQLSE